MKFPAVRSWWLAAIALVAAVAVTACGGSPSPSASAAGGTGSDIHGVVVQPPIPKPDAVLTDTSGNPYSLQQQTAGYLTLLYFGYTNCPDACPTIMADLGSALKSLPASVSKRVRVVFVTTDPGRDTPEVLRKWLNLFDTDFVGLTGTQAQLDALQTATGLPPAEKEDTGTDSYGVSHASSRWPSRPPTTSRTRSTRLASPARTSPTTSRSSRRVAGRGADVEMCLRRAKG